VLSDHINFMGTNPLIGPNQPQGPRFPDLSRAYDPSLRQQLHAAAEGTGQRLREGVYLAVTGPSYESPAEIRAFRTLGADAVGMSTVPETIVARHEGMQVAGMSCLCNMAAGILPEALSHEEVLAAGAAAAKGFEALVRRFLRDLSL
jgi:purine-nucleoside phosphorylase